VNNRGPTYRFRNEVLLFLHSQGFPSATKPRDIKGAPPSDRHGDLTGIPGVTLAVRNQRDINLGGSQDEVAIEAAAEGNEIWASIQHRRGYSVENAMVTMPLHVFVRLLHEVVPQEGALAAVG
jgi:hypothetical protein